VAGHPDAECSFSTLSGGAGGLVANLNRWRSQMSLDPLDDAAVAALPKKPFLGRPATFVEWAGTYRGRGDRSVPDALLLGLVAEMPAASAFLKLTGPSKVVVGEKARFLALAESLTPDAGGAPSSGPAEPAGGGPVAPPPFAWQVPAGWKRLGDRSMRIATFVPEKAPNAEVAVSILGGAAGGARANADRWRSQMGLPSLSDESFAALPRRTVFGNEAVFVFLEGAYAGMEPGRGKAGWMLLGMIAPRGDRTVFVKMTGPAEEVRGERERFTAFCESFHD
jgi:hypothetical protein